MRMPACARAGSLLGSAQAKSGEEREVGRALERRAGRAAGRELGWAGKRGVRCWAKNRIEEEIPFLFLFPIFQSIFQKDFEFPFEFNSNHSIQKFKCSSMNAQTCSYPYI
jgi:hypothetical protein